MSTETNASNLMPDFSVKLPDPKRENSSSSESSRGKDRAPPEFYLNVGVQAKNPLYDPKVEGSTEHLFINVPLGIGLDSIRESLPKIPDETSKNPEYRLKVIGQHQLVKMLEEAMAGTAEGIRKHIPSLSAELYHVKKSKSLEDVKSGNNLLADFKLFG